jgi:signal transduction histidine kinase
MCKTITTEFEDGIRKILTCLQTLLDLPITASQIWSLDSQGFHVIWNDKTNKSAFREIARNACLQNIAIRNDLIIACPFRFNERQSAAIVVKLQKACSAEAFEKFDQFMQKQSPLLESLITAQGLDSLSGSAKRADYLRTVLSLAYDVEKSNKPANQYAEIHSVLKNIMYAQNFFIVTLNSNGTILNFDYAVDEFDEVYRPISLEEGVLQGSLSAYVVKSCKMIRGNSTQLFKDIMGFDTTLREFGEEAYDWIGVPLAKGKEVYGAIVVQSYDKLITFEEGDPNLLTVIAEAITNSLQRKQLRKKLEQTVAQRTLELENSNHQLELNINELKSMQKQLIEAEKQASLGRLVTGIAHELNTPLGVSITATSMISDDTNKLANELASGTLTKTGLSTLLHSLLSSSELLARNIDKAAMLIDRFKDIASIQHADDLSSFNFKELIDNIKNHQPIMSNNLSYQLDIDCPNKLWVHSYPKLIKKIIIQLIDNSIRHGFSKCSNGQINICIEQVDKNIVMHYADDGVGFAPSLIRTIFDPFVTTNRFGGNVGIGLHMVSNIVTQSLKGTLHLEGKPAQGFHLQIKFPADITLNS